MRIAMFTNSYLPQVGGVARSVERFTCAYRRLGHRVLVVAPEYREPSDDDPDVVRVPAIQHFNGSDFSVTLLVSLGLSEVIDDFQPEIIHAHHPFLIGNTALRVAAERGLPLVFTHHTMYEHYTHYVPLHLEALRRYVLELSTGFANLSDRVIAPSRSVAEILEQRGVRRPIAVVPTGVELEQFERGDGAAFRRRHEIDSDAFVIGHVGRLAPEKNLAFLARAVADVLARRPRSGFVVIGAGVSRQAMRDIFAGANVLERVRFAGICTGSDLVDAYHAMDLFAFASKTETQGMVLVEALAAGCPVAALDAPGAREVVRDGENGRLIVCEDEAAFAEAIDWAANLPAGRRERLRRRARQSAEPFSTDRCVRSTLDIYSQVLGQAGDRPAAEITRWASLQRSLQREWDIWANRARALAESIGTEPNGKS